MRKHYGQVVKTCIKIAFASALLLIISGVLSYAIKGKVIAILEIIAGIIAFCAVIFIRNKRNESVNNFLEIMAKNITKATAIEKLCELKNISIEKTIAFGDNYNDFEMLTTVKQGFLMDNAPDELKKLIKLHTDSNDNDGIYKALKELSLLD